MENHIRLLAAAEEREVRIVLIGKTGAGKSASGNTILGRNAFESTLSPSSVTSECKKETGSFAGQNLAVIDTPGLFDTRLSQDDVKTEIARCVSLAAPGPHAFLVVIEPRRFTEEERRTVRIIQTIFGERAADYTMVLFTHGDDLRADGVSIQTFISGSSDLRGFVRQSKGGFHLFNNRSRNRAQVRNLLRKINRMVQRNGGTFFTNHMLREAREAIQEELQRLNMKLEEARREAERQNRFMREVLLYLMRQREAERHVMLALPPPPPGPIAVSPARRSPPLRAPVATVSLAASGATIGSFGGPLGAALGGAVGAVAGLAVDTCVIQ